jgi:ATP-dependent DNA helicase RecG
MEKEAIEKPDMKSKEKGKVKTVEKIIKAIKEKPSITVKELADLLSLTRRGVEYNLSKLKEQNKIRRIGSDKGGHWEVIE